VRPLRLGHLSQVSTQVCVLCDAASQALLNVVGRGRSLWVVFQTTRSQCSLIACTLCACQHPSISLFLTLRMCVLVSGVERVASGEVVSPGDLSTDGGKYARLDLV
jgi:hypothetical protein